MGWSLTARAVWQSWNGAAVRALAEVALRPRALLRPCECVANISHIDAGALRARGIRAVVLDKDNTVTAPYADDVHADAAQGLARLRAVFPGLRGVVILSNSAGTPDDAGHADARRIEERLGLPVIRHARKKPDCIDDVLAFLNSGSDGGGGGTSGANGSSSTVAGGAATGDGHDNGGGDVGSGAVTTERGDGTANGDGHGDNGDGPVTDGPVTAEQVAMVGDRLLTDVVFGNLHGMYTIHCQPLSTANDNPAARIIRSVENSVLLPLVRP